ncbi:GNAT family N-acetyltransferase [Paludisphaera rhizosphaerae]|uniref:GNAT family N-acetyltransferase n=1 Tax=Paludisphaera rhizosphaerae TaxID=2711216 RepID=UPI0013EC80C4|nr:GNAT family N-acetyltransferase [Paludisphaera rhizosphaerae]
MSDSTHSGESKADFKIRQAVPEDCQAIANLIRELAIYEKLDQFAKATAEDFRQHLFGSRPYAEVLLAEIAGEPVGLALFFHTFSTFRGQPGIYLEDLFVQPEHRGRGIGKALLGTLAKLTLERKCGRLEWAVLDWNEPAIGFYKSLGAGPLDEWITYRIADEPLAELAREAPKS